MVNKDLIKRLSHSSERPIRDKAFDELEALININGVNFEDIELRGLFEGIFWWFWFADKPSYQESLAKRIVKFSNAFTKEEEKQTWMKYFFKWLSIHWNSIDYHSVNEYLTLVRMQLVALFEHIEELWENNNRKEAQNYMNIIYVESLYESDVPLGLGMHVADIYIDEISKAFKKDTLKHKQIAQLLSPFLNALGHTQQLALFERIKVKVFQKLIESNGLESDESNSTYFPKFDIVEYAEVDIFSVASDAETMESRRTEIYEIYDKASGKHKEKDAPLPYIDRLKALQDKPVFKPQTKHQKKQTAREKTKEATKIKKRILKMIRNQALQTFPGYGAEDSKVEMEGAESTKSVDQLTNGILAKLSDTITEKEQKKVKEVKEPKEVKQVKVVKEKKEKVVAVTQANGDKVIEILAPEKKIKSKKRKMPPVIVSKSSNKRVIFELEKNKTREFYLHGKVGVDDIPKSKDKLSDRPSIIRKNLHKKRKL